MLSRHQTHRHYRPRKRAKLFDLPKIKKFPSQVAITAGLNPDGSLRVFHFHNPGEAHAAGFHWAGRPTGS